GGEGLGQDAPTTAHVEDTLTPEPAEHAPEIFDAQRVQLVEPGEGPGVAPPDAGDPLHQALVLLGLGKASEAGEVVGHGTEIYGVGEVGGGWGRLGRLLPTYSLVQLPREGRGSGDR